MQKLLRGSDEVGLESRQWATSEHSTYGLTYAKVHGSPNRYTYGILL